MSDPIANTESAEVPLHTPDTKLPKLPRNQKSPYRRLRSIKKKASSVFYFLVALVGLPSAIVIILPKIQISPYTSLNLKNPYEARFNLQSTGWLAINDVHYACVTWMIHKTDGYLAINGSWPEYFTLSKDTSRNLEHDDPYSVRCWPPQISESDQESMDYARIEFRVSFRPSFWPFYTSRNASFYFCRSSNGDVVWMPTGNSKSFEQWIKRDRHEPIAPPVCPHFSQQ